MKTVILLLILSAFAFGQFPQPIDTVPDTSSLKTMRGGDGQIMYLRQYSSTDTSGGGWFRAKTSSESTGSNYFDHPSNGVQWVRQEVVALELVHANSIAELQTLELGNGRSGFLEKISSSNPNGGGWWMVIDSTYSEVGDVVATDHPTTGKQWVRTPFYVRGAPINIKEGGAYGDSTTNDYQAITNCISMAKTLENGSVIYVPTGDFVTGTTIQFEVTGDTIRNVVLKGDGFGSRIIAAPGLANSFMNFKRAVNCGVEDMNFQGEGNDNNGIHFENGRDCFIRNTTVRGFKQSNVSIKGMWGMEITNVFVINDTTLGGAANHGIDLDVNGYTTGNRICKRVRITNCDIRNSGYEAIKVENAQDVIISGCILGNRISITDDDRRLANVRGVKIENCEFYRWGANVGLNAIQLKDGVIKIHDNIFDTVNINAGGPDTSTTHNDSWEDVDITYTAGVATFADLRLVDANPTDVYVLSNLLSIGEIFTLSGGGAFNDYTFKITAIADDATLDTITCDVLEVPASITATADSTIAMYRKRGAAVTITENTVINNTNASSTYYGGIYVHDLTNAIISTNTVQNVDAGASAGMGGIIALRVNHSQMIGNNISDIAKETAESSTTAGFHFTSCTGLNVSGGSVAYSGGMGLYASGCKETSFTGINFFEIDSSSIFIVNGFTNGRVEKNTIKDSGRNLQTAAASDEKVGQITLQSGSITQNNNISISYNIIETDSMSAGYGGIYTDGFFYGQMNGNIITNGRAATPFIHGIYAWRNFDYSIMSDNVFKHPNYGIYAQETHYSTIKNNNIYDSNNYGIFLKGITSGTDTTRATVLKDNYLFNCGTAAGFTLAGISVDDPTTLRIKIMGNIFEATNDSVDHAIHIQSGATNTLIYNNYIDTTNTSYSTAIQDDGTTTVDTLNYIP